jgi:hypothetical protein
LADSHLFSRRVAICDFYLPELTILSAARHRYVLWPLKACDSRLQGLEFKWRVENSATFFRTSWGFLRHTKAEPESFKSLRYHRLPGSLPFVVISWASFLSIRTVI